MSWRNASWLAPLDDQSAPQGARHAAAVGILESHTVTGRPFAPFLHAFSVLQFYGGKADGSGSMPLDAHLDKALRAAGANLIKVQDPDGMLDALPDEVPGLRLENATWLDAASALAAWGDDSHPATGRTAPPIHGSPARVLGLAKSTTCGAYAIGATRSSHDQPPPRLSLSETHDSDAIRFVEAL